MVRIRLEGEISRNGKSLKESIAPASNSDSGRQVSEERGPSFSPSYFAAAESECGSCVSNRTNPDFSPSITSVFPATNSETDCRSVFHGTPPKYPQSNSIVLSFPAAKSQTYSSENDEIFQNPSQATATHPYTMSVSYNGPTTDFSPSIPLFFPPNMSETETGSSESNETPQPFSNSILLFFPPARSQTNSSENDEIFQNSSQATATHPYTTSVSYNGPTTDFSPSIPLFFPPNRSETETGSSESNETPQPFSNSILSFFPPARSQTNSSENDEIIQNPSIASFCDAYVFHNFWRSQSILHRSSLPPRRGQAKKPFFFPIRSSDPIPSKLKIVTSSLHIGGVMPKEKLSFSIYPRSLSELFFLLGNKNLGFEGNREE